MKYLTKHEAMTLLGFLLSIMSVLFFGPLFADKHVFGMVLDIAGMILVFYGVIGGVSLEVASLALRSAKIRIDITDAMMQRILTDVNVLRGIEAIALAAVHASKPARTRKK